MATLLDLLPAGIEPAELAILAAVFVSVLIAVGGAAAFAAPRDPVSRRFAEAGGMADETRPANVDLWVDRAPTKAKGWWGFLLPADGKERSETRRRLWRAGFQGSHVVRGYYLVRTLLALFLPLPVVAIVLFTSLNLGGGALRFDLGGVPVTTPLLLVLLLVALGFYGPAVVVRLRIDARQEAARRAFPTALDLLQLSVESGLGVDAAIQKVAEEMVLAQPALAREFGQILVELRAGKPRQTVLADFAERTGVEEVRSFVAVLQQTVEFGTDMAEALRVFASEMRRRRMVLAEEKANKLSVKLSMAVVTLMLPAILAMLLGPIVIRVVRVVFPALAG
jgi:tight adherence protein C